jgi:hypothetical protein
MKIRTITAGTSLEAGSHQKAIQAAADACRRFRDAFTGGGYDVQSLRITAQPMEEYLEGLSAKRMLELVQDMEETYLPLEIECMNPGVAKSAPFIDLIPEIIARTRQMYCSASITGGGRVIPGLLERAAMAIRKMADETENGEGNFRFAAIANCPGGIPFFPAGYHDGGEMKVSLGMECSDLLMDAFTGAKDFDEAEERLRAAFERETSKIEGIAQSAARSASVSYGGIDVSLAPSMEESESVAYAYEKLGIGYFGDPGTLAVSALVTRTLKGLPVKKCGYSGLMLPVCEDPGLARRCSEGKYNLTSLLCYSAVCGTGLDTVPLPGGVSTEKLKAILWDVGTLATTLNKPLSARLLPAPQKKAGDMTDFKNQYLVNCRVFSC